MSTLKQVAGRRPRKTYDEGRHCSAKGCETQLSRYNKNEYCWTHFQPIPRPARIAPPPKTD